MSDSKTASQSLNSQACTSAVQGGLTLPFNCKQIRITTCTDTLNSLTLPADPLCFPNVYSIRNDGTHYLQVFPPDGGQLNGLAADAVGLILGAGASVEVYALTDLLFYSKGYDGPKAVVELSAAKVLTKAYNNCVFALTSAGANYTINLPAPTIKGLNFEFNIIATAGTNHVQIASTAANACGYKVLVGTATTEATAKTNVFLGDAGVAASTIGDKISMHSNGTNYVWNGYGAVAASIKTT